MDVIGLFAVIHTAGMQAAEAFYTGLIGRGPDDRPMASMIQWRNLGGGALQIVEDAGKAGHSGITVVTPSMDAARTALAAAGVTLDEDVRGDFGIIAQLSDPDGNLITLAEPPKGMPG